LVAITGIPGGAIAWLWPDKTLQWFIVLAIALGWGQGWFDLNLTIINTRLSPIRYGVLTSVKALSSIGLAITLFYLGWGVTGILIGLIISLWFSTLLICKYWQDFSVRHYDVRLLKNFIGYGSPMILTLILALVVDTSDRFFLKWLMDAKTVGSYSAAYDLAQQSLGMLTNIVHLAAFPLALRALEEKGVTEARNQLRQNALLLLTISVPATVGMFMLADNIAIMMLGTEFREGAGRIIALVALSIFVSGIKSFYFDYSFQLSRKMGGQVWVVMWAALANIGFNLWWIPIYGMVGAAYATLGAFLVGLFFSWYLGRKVFVLPPFPKESYKVLLASAGMAASLWAAMRWDVWSTLGGRNSVVLFGQVVLGCIVYAILLLIFDLGQSRLKLTRYLTRCFQ